MPVLSRSFTADAAAPVTPRWPGLTGGAAGADWRYAELLLDDREHVARGQDQVLLAGVLDLGAAVLGVQHHVADVVVEAARADGQDGALLWLLLCRVRNDNAGRRSRLGLARLDHDAVLERLDVDLGSGRHDLPPPPGGFWLSACGGDRGAARRRGCRADRVAALAL